MDRLERNRKIIIVSTAVVAVFLMANPSFASNIIDTSTGGTVANDANVKQGVDFINWAITAFCGVGSVIFLMSGFSNLKHGHYGPAALGISSGFGSGIACYLAHTYFLK